MSGPTGGMADLVATALLGTGRRPSVVDGWPGALGAAAAAVGDGDLAAVLLSRAALATVWLRAGALPAAAGTSLPAPAERLPAAPPAAARRLVGLLEARETGLLEEWLALASVRGCVVPPALLPDLLDHGTRLAVVRPALRVVTGERGVWLARQRPEWAWLPRLVDAAPAAPAGGAPEPPDLTDDAWRLGDRAARLRWLIAVRAVEPARARAAVEADWRAEPGPARAGLLAVLADGLSPADEAFLEHALDDRRKDVRETAARLLAGLPGSALGIRMTQRARAAIRLDRGLLRTRLVVEVPDELDAAAVRDGIVDPPADAATILRDEPATGRRAGWLRQIVAATPLAGWADLGPPERVVAITVADGWAPVLQAGWAAAAGREGSSDWAAALLGVGVDLGAGLGAERLAALLSALAAGERARLAALVVRQARARIGARDLPADAPAVLTAALAGCARPWSPDLVDAVLGWVAAAAGRLPLWPYQGLVDLFAHALPPAVAPGLGSLAAPNSEDGARWAARLQRAATTLTIRAEMLEEFR